MNQSISSGEAPVTFLVCIGGGRAVGTARLKDCDENAGFLRGQGARSERGAVIVLDWTSFFEEGVRLVSFPGGRHLATHMVNGMVVPDDIGDAVAGSISSLVYERNKRAEERKVRKWVGGIVSSSSSSSFSSSSTTSTTSSSTTTTTTTFSSSLLPLPLSTSSPPHFPPFSLAGDGSLPADPDKIWESAISRGLRPLVLAHYGSVRYNLAVEGVSDMDLLLVVSHRADSLLGLRPLPETSRLSSGQDSVDDVTVIEAKTFALGLLSGNARYLETLFCRSHLRCTPEWEELAGLRSKVFEGVGIEAFVDAYRRDALGDRGLPHLERLHAEPAKFQKQLETKGIAKRAYIIARCLLLASRLEQAARAGPLVEPWFELERGDQDRELLLRLRATQPCDHGAIITFLRELAQNHPCLDTKCKPSEDIVEILHTWLISAREPS